ncbi:alpha/beta hydrolase, partial [Escherichia coli]
QVNKANIVGHSMGGVSGLRYLGTYGQDTSLPKIEKFVSIGAPFNDFIDTSQHQWVLIYVTIYQVIFDQFIVSSEVKNTLQGTID